MNFRGLFLLTALTSAASLVQCYTFPEFSEKQHMSFKENISVSRHGISASASIRWGSGNPPRQVDYPFQNTSLPWDARVDDLVSRLSLQEIMVQMARGGAGEYTTPAPAIPRLGKLSVALWCAVRVNTFHFMKTAKIKCPQTEPCGKPLPLKKEPALFSLNLNQLKKIAEVSIDQCK